MKSIKELVAQYGSQQKLADAMGVHRPQVSRWVKLNAHIDEDGDVYIKTRPVNPVYEVCGDEPNEWRDIATKALAVLQVNSIPLIGDYPERCLREIEAKAVKKFFAHFESASFWDKTVNDVIDEGYEYAERIKRGEG